MMQFVASLFADPGAVSLILARSHTLGLNEIYVWFLLPTYPNFFNPTLNIKMVFGEMGTFSDFVTLLNVITKFDNFPTYLP